MTNRKFLLPIIIALSAACWMACNSPYTSRKKGYYNIELPQHSYRDFNRESFPYSFQYPAYANIIQDSTYFDASPENNFWINIDFPQFNARVFLSYKAIGGKAIYKIKQKDGSYRDSLGINEFERMRNDAYTLTNKNGEVASSIKDSQFVTKNGIGGIYFKVGGNAATGRQFFMTDTTHHFIRGALYFEATPNADSIRPVQDFLQKDIEHLISTFRWK
ncbi:hypothetical protein [Ferruginibacter sp. HRS2-29]|uniref:gliding motility lipoprotein GldD n=1 Tax=Ferruginibacter sp. HRS2-29 TaxID=2487334 RepID=UPI0020CDD970|nr:hypothetical protein [Ferruginibacter sp. HRS2-29]MCP9752567.1 hypothetical protein [Ferruginibacter sp. HRS2-29]